MRDLEYEVAYEATSKAAYALVRDLVNGIIYDAKECDIDPTSDDFRETVERAVDDALTYKVTHYVCAWGLPDTDAEDYGQSENFQKGLALQAYCNLLEAVTNHSDLVDFVKGRNE